MNILIVNYEFPPIGGGAGNATYNLIKHLAKNPDINTSLLFGTDPKYGSFPKVDQVKMYPIAYQRKGIHDAGIFGMISFLFKALPCIKKIIAKDKIELVHYFFSLPTGLLTLFLYNETPYIVSLRGGDVPGFNIGQFQLMHSCLKPINVHIWRKAAALIANSEDLGKAAHRISSRVNYEVIPNGIDTSFFNTQPQKKEGKLKIITVTRLVNWKGLEFLIEAVKDLDVELSIIGKGQYESVLKRKAGANVSFFGYIDRHKLPMYYNKADIFVMPSLSEGMSNSVLEAMACGLPLILTDTGGAKNLINNNGYIVNKCSSESIKNALKKYLDNRNLIKKHGIQSRIISEKLSWESMTNRYASTYRRILNKLSD